MAQVDISYQAILNSILSHGYRYKDKSRDNMEMIQISSMNINLEIKEDFPLLTTKEMFFKGIVTELLWFLRGDDNIKFLLDNGVNIWNDDAYNYYKRKCLSHLLTPSVDIQEFISLSKQGVKNINLGDYTYGDVGKNYGVQWTKWKVKDVDEDSERTTNQIATTIANLLHNPMSRRHIVTAWNPAELGKTALPACHWGFEVLPRPLYGWERVELIPGSHPLYPNNPEQMHKRADEYGITKYGLILKWHQRSCDTFLGVPFNIASYGLLLHILAILTGYQPLGIIGDLSNVHIYGPHEEKVKELLRNDPNRYPAPKLKISDQALEILKRNDVTFTQKIYKLAPEDFSLEGYESYGKLSAKMYAPKV